MIRTEDVLHVKRVIFTLKLRREDSASASRFMIILAEFPGELCETFQVLIHEKKSVNDSTRFNDELFAKLESLVEDKCTTPNQRERILILYSDRNVSDKGIS